MYLPRVNTITPAHSNSNSTECHTNRFDKIDTFCASKFNMTSKYNKLYLLIKHGQTIFFTKLYSRILLADTH